MTFKKGLKDKSEEKEPPPKKIKKEKSHLNRERPTVSYLKRANK